MGKGKYIFYFLKLFIVSSYILFVIFGHLSGSNDKNYSEIMSKKDYLLGEVCLSILGGSNVKLGISADQLNTQHCAVKNYGVDYEGGSFENYKKWFSKDLKSKSVIYSPIASLAQDVDYQNYSGLFPTTSIMSEIKRILMNKSEVSNAEYDLFGDLVKYDCRVQFRPFKIKTKGFLKNNELIAIEVNRRLKLIAEITDAKEIFVRIPPVYVNERNLETYKSLMKKRIEIFREMGINVIETTIASSDISLFCDAADHPNAKGRYFFTNELKEKLKIH